MKARLTIKKPSYIGTAAQLLGSHVEAAYRGRSAADRARAARAAVGKALLEREIEIIRISGSRFVLTEPGFLKNSPVRGVELEARAVIVWAGDDGAILVSTGATPNPA